MNVFQIGSSLENEKTANDLDLLIVSDKPVDICLYTSEQWQEFIKIGSSDTGRRIVMHPLETKGSKSLKMRQLLYLVSIIIIII